jgi:hypothetical protein
MCSILCWILSIWEALGCIFLYFWIDSCIVNKGEKFEHDLTCCMPSGFELFLSLGSFPGGIGLTDEGHRFDRCSPQVLGDLVHRSDRSELSCCNCSVSCGGLHAFVQGELHWFRRSLHVCRGALCGFSSFGLVVYALCLSIVLSRMCWAVTLA